ncbi:hypothetical protein M9458_055538 [Cirrhinus mrigala]|uniref:Uncharacterized protein n=1 Tax=Cirrhinus mrigala TaxID=683832 RepID=A0ABD0MKD2_CIRMR
MSIAASVEGLPSSDAEDSAGQLPVVVVAQSESEAKLMAMFPLAASTARLEASLFGDTVQEYPSGLEQLTCREECLWKGRVSSACRRRLLAQTGIAPLPFGGVELATSRGRSLPLGCLA